MSTTPPIKKIPVSMMIRRPRAPQAGQSDLLQDVSVYKSVRAITASFAEQVPNPPTQNDTSVTFANGVFMQWVAGPEDTDAAEHEHIVTWPTPFTTVVYTIQVSTVRPQGGSVHADDIFEYQVISWTLTDVTIYRARRGDDNPITTSSLILGIGF